MKKFLSTFSFIIFISILLCQEAKADLYGDYTQQGNWFIAPEDGLNLQGSLPNLKCRYALGAVNASGQVMFVEAISTISSSYASYYNKRQESVHPPFSKTLTQPKSYDTSKDNKKFNYYKGSVAGIKEFITQPNPDGTYSCNIGYLFLDYKYPATSGGSATANHEELWIKGSYGRLTFSDTKDNLTLKWENGHWRIYKDNKYVLKLVSNRGDYDVKGDWKFFFDEVGYEDSRGYDVTIFMNKLVENEPTGLKKIEPESHNDSTFDAILNNNSYLYSLSGYDPVTFFIGGLYGKGNVDIFNDETNQIPNLIVEDVNGMNLKNVTLSPTPSLANKTYNLICDVEGDLDYSETTVLLPHYKTIKLKIISNKPVWSYGGKNLSSNRLTLTYTNENDIAHQIDQTFDSSALDSPVLPYGLDMNEPFWGFVSDGFRFTREGGLCLYNSEVLDFNDINDTRQISLRSKDRILPANVIGNVPDLEVTVKPAKPTLELTYQEIPFPDDEWGEYYGFRFPKGIFEEGTEYGFYQYARVLLIPQFDTFEHETAATDFYGTAPKATNQDSWLCHNWYQEKGIEGFMPAVEWSDYDQEYYFTFNPCNMMYYDWDGDFTREHRLVSGHYKVQLVPSTYSMNRQYGVVASDPVDLYIYPSHKNMTLSLFQKDKADGEAYWKNYSMNNVDYLFTGPRADADKNGNTSGGHGETAYRHARLTANSDYCEVWVENNYHRPAYPDGEIPGQKVSRKDVARAADDNQSLEGYTKLEPDDYVDFSGDGQVNVKLVKNGAVSPAQTISVQKTGSPIITGIDDVTINSKSTRPEYFTPAGIKIETPTAPGLYIERLNGQTRKVVLK